MYLSMFYNYWSKVNVLNDLLRLQLVAKLLVAINLHCIGRRRQVHAVTLCKLRSSLSYILDSERDILLLCPHD